MEALKAESVDSSVVCLNTLLRELNADGSNPLGQVFTSLERLHDDSVKCRRKQSAILVDLSKLIAVVAVETQQCEKSHPGDACGRAQVFLAQLLHPAMLGVCAVEWGFELARGKDMPK